MESQKRCYISMPFGIKTDPASGRLYDFDRVYTDVVQRAATAAGYSPVRADNLIGSVVFRAVLEQVISCEVFIADVTTANPNVMYELGLRHALSGNATVLIMESGSRLPYDISYSRVVIYEYDLNGNLLNAEDAVGRLTEVLRQGIGRVGSDSPVYMFFPDLQVTLPSEFAKVARRTKTLPPGLPEIESLKQAEKEIKDGKEIDPASVIEVLKGYQGKSAWESLVQFASGLSVEMKEIPQVAQMTALALNRLGKRDDAITLLQSFVNKTGGDSESYGILGKIYKDIYESTKNAENLELAIRNYGDAYKLAPNDYYAGFNLVHLLAIQGGDQSQALLRELLPKLRDQLAQRVADPRADFWDLGTAIELAVIARDWNAADDLVRKVAEEPREEWTIEPIARNLASLGDAMMGQDRDRLERLVNNLRECSKEMQRNA